MRRRLHQRTGFMLALLAMLLITFAPMVSQVLAAQQHTFDLSTELCSAHAKVADHSGSSNHESDSLAHLDGQACAYCHFFAHAPALPTLRGLFVLDVHATQTPVIAFVQGERRVTPLTLAQPRAPPVLI